MASFNYVSVYSPKTSFGIGGASAFGTSTYSDVVGFVPSTTMFSPIPLLYHLQVLGKQTHWHKISQLDQLVQLAKMLIVLILPITIPLMLLK